MNVNQKTEDLNISRYKKLKNLPVNLVTGYLVFILFLYAYGPFDWITYSPVLFYGYQLFYILYFFLGYKIGMRLSNKKRIVWTQENDKKLIKYLVPLSTINCMVIFINILRDFGYSYINFSEIFQDLYDGIFNMGSSYVDHYERITHLSGASLVGGSFMTLLNLLWEFAGFNILLLDIYYFKKEGKGMKAITMISCLETIIFYVAIGTNIGVFRIVAAIAIFYVLRTMRKNCSASMEGKSKYIRKMLVMAVVAVVIVVIYFIFTMKSRGGDIYWSLQYCNIGGIGLDMDSLFFKICPEPFYMAMISISGYLTQGLYGFSMCTQLGWQPTFGLGSSMGMVDLISKHILNVGSLTYQYRIQETFGWDQKVQWCSMYSWFANDVGLFGVVVIMFFIGLFLAMIYRDSITTDNPFAKLLMIYLALMCIFIPCNNQVMQSTYTLFSFITALIAWIVTSKVKILIRK